MKTRYSVLAVLAVLLLPVFGQAEVRSGAVTLTPLLGYQAFDGELDLDDGTAYGVALGYTTGQHWVLELDFRYTPSEVDAADGPDVNAVAVTANALYHFLPEQTFVPYLVAGVGGLQYEIDGSGHDDEDFIANWGGGFKYAVTGDLDLRLDLRHTIDFRSDNRGDSDGSDTASNVAAMCGLNIQFGGVSQRPVSSTVRVPPVPAAASFPAVAPAIGSEPVVGDDRDGVPEPADRCPGTAPGVRVDSTGCPADTDRDGVADYRDACIDTRPGAKVDPQGCPEVVPAADVLPLAIRFGVGRSEVNPFHYRELDRVAAFIRQHPHTQLLVEVPADPQGLSTARAESLRRVLIARYGVPAGQIVAQGESLAGRGVVVSVIP